MTHRGRSGDIDIVAQSDRRHQRRIAADLNAVADFGFIFLKSVIVTGDRAGADIGVAADGHIAQISQMIRLGAVAEFGFFGFDEIADMNVAAQDRCPDADGQTGQ